MADSLKAVADIIGALGSIAWPIIVVILVWKLIPLLRELRPFILKFLGTRGVKVKIGDVEISLQDATESVRTQIAELQKKVEELSQTRGVAVERSFAPETAAASAVESPGLDGGAAAASVAGGTGRSAAVLWVDDDPAGTAYEQARLRDGGVEVVTAATTAQAMELAKAAGRPFDAVVTGLRRTEGGVERPRAGLELVRALRGGAFAMPVVVHSPGRRVDVASIREEVKAAGGDGFTGSTMELFTTLRSLAGVRA